MLLIDEHFKTSWKPKTHHWNRKDTLLKSFEDENAFPFVLAIRPFAGKQDQPESTSGVNQPIYCLTGIYLFEVQGYQNLWKGYDCMIV